MKKFAVLLGLLIIGGAVFYGCGPRFNVLKNKVVDGVDKLLGELDVKQEKILALRADLTKQMDTVREQAISSQVRMEQAEKQKKALEIKAKELEGKLGKMKELLTEVDASETKTITRNGTEYKAEDLNRMANELISESENNKTLMSAVNTSYEALKRSHDFLSNQQNAAKDSMTKLDQRLSEIKAKKTAVQAVRDANKSAVGEDSSLMTKLDELNKQIDEMDIDLETKMRVEEKKLSEASSSAKTYDDLLTEPADVGSTMSKIDEILGKSSSDK